jgi:hypothetical protein
MLDHLESYASYEIGRRTPSPAWNFRMFNLEAHVDIMLSNMEVIFSRLWMDWKQGWTANPLPFYVTGAPTGVCHGAI